MNVPTKKESKLAPQMDSIVTESNKAQTQLNNLNSTKVTYFENTKRRAKVIHVYDRNSSPIVGTTIETIFNTLAEEKKANFIHCHAVAENAEGDADSDLTTISKSDLKNKSLQNQIAITNSAYFYTVDNLTTPILEGAIIEIDYLDNDLDEGLIISVIAPAPATEIGEESGGENDGSNLNDYDNSTGDGKQDDSYDTPTGKCGNGSDYPYEDCKTAAFTSNGQTVTLHPTFWNNMENLLNTIKQNENYVINIGSAYRSPEKQLNIRKSRCPEWQGRISEQELRTAKWSDVIAKCNCKDKTSVAAASGVYASNHTKGLAVDFKMDIKPCSANNVSSVSYENCKKNSNVYKLLEKYADTGIQHIEDIKEFKKMARKGILDKGYTPLMSIGDMYWDVGEYGGIGIIVLPDN
jgi:hypothetical protein